MSSSEVRNYATPGLTSHLIGAGAGKVRLFSADRDTHTHQIHPHSHRFDFVCLVLKGQVVNTTFVKRYHIADDRNSYAVSTLTFNGAFGNYDFLPGTTPELFEEVDMFYETGAFYSMKANEIHSIEFRKGTEVLFFEGPSVSRTSVVLEPWSDGARVPTFKTHEWMFQK